MSGFVHLGELCFAKHHTPLLIHLKIKTPPTPKELNVYVKSLDSPLGDTPPAIDGRDEFCAFFLGLQCVLWFAYLNSVPCCITFYVQIMVYVRVWSVSAVGAGCECVHKVCVVG